VSGRLETLKSQLAARGLVPRKALGQNFLIDPNFARAVVAEAAVDVRTLVLEIGPGTGALTRAVLDASPHARVLALELDHGLARLMREEFSAEIETRQLTLLEGDVLDGKHGVHRELIEEALRISQEEARPRRVLCANLPYNVATPLLANLALPLRVVEEERNPSASVSSPSTRATDGKSSPWHEGNGEVTRLVERAVATVQLELADRLLGRHGTNDYGPLAVLLALRARGGMVRKVGAEIFWPRPAVSSAVVALDYLPWQDGTLKAEDAWDFQDFVQKLFQRRRKTLRAALKIMGLLLDSSDPRASTRAEDLAPEELLNLFYGYRGNATRLTPPGPASDLGKRRAARGPACVV